MALVFPSRVFVSLKPFLVGSFHSGRRNGCLEEGRVCSRNWAAAEGKEQDVLRETPCSGIKMSKIIQPREET